MLKRILAVIIWPVTVLTSLFFLLGGIIYILISLGIPPGGTGDLPWYMFLLVGIIAVVIGAASWKGGFSLARSLWTDGQLTTKFRDTPWLIRPEWRVRQVASSGRVFARWYWLNAFAFIVVFGFFFLVSVTQEVEKEYDTLFLLVPALAAAGAVFVAVRAHMQQVRFGISHLRFSRLPITPGSLLDCKVLVSQTLRGAPEITAHLTCVKHIRVQRGRKIKYIPQTTWSDQKTVLASQLQASGERLFFPLQFQIPADAEETFFHLMGPTTWKIETKAKLPGVDFRATFELPVFRTERKAEETILEQLNISP